MSAASDAYLLETYGKLTVIRVNSSRHGRIAVCRCECGGEISVRAVELRRGARRQCTRQHPCPMCEEMFGNQGFKNHAVLCDGGGTARSRARRQVMDLAEMRAAKSGQAQCDSDCPEGPSTDLLFIQSQAVEAVPLLVKLFSLSEDKINAIRSRGKGRKSERMPLRLLAELVEQRTGKYYVDHFIDRESSIGLCVGA